MINQVHTPKLMTLFERIMKKCVHSLYVYVDGTQKPRSGPRGIKEGNDNTRLLTAIDAIKPII